MVKKENIKFDAQVDKVFKLVIHSLYQNKEIFLRELISNASDACDKLRYLSIKEPKVLGEDKEFKITITPNKEENTLTIEDNGLGMTKQELIENLGTIARSGTQGFLEQLTGNKKNDSQLIGQFGVGFYSAFMVADEITVFSKSYQEDEKAHKWFSKGDDGFSIEECDYDDRGTKIILKLKDEERAFVDQYQIRNIVKTYSNHVAFDIILLTEGEKDGKKFIDEEKINSSEALWLKQKKDVKQEEYDNFYQGLSHLGTDEPWLTLHNKVEGALEYTSLLFIPSKKPFDLFHPDRQTRLKLYIKRTFISETNIDLIPQYLRFLQGVVDSEDLPLNISRETIQNSAILQKIKKSVTNKVLSELSKKLERDRDEYLKFWENFGAVIKEGLCDGIEDRELILKTCLFNTSKDDELITLAEYKKRMQPGQNVIYYITGDDLQQAKKSPQIEGFVSKDIEVLLLCDSVDEFWVNVLNEYDGTQLKSVHKASSDLDDLSGEKKQSDKDKKSDKKDEVDNVDLQKLIAFFKDALGENVSDVVSTKRLKESPVCLSVAENAMDIRFERFLVENKQLPKTSAKILEVNPEHQIIKNLIRDVKDNKDPARSNDVVHLLFAQANIIEGEPVNDVAAFTKRMNVLVENALAS